MSGKGSKRRPGKGYAEGHDRIFGGKPTEPYYLCMVCLEEVHKLPPDGLDYCLACGRIVEGNTLKCIREIDHDKT